MVYWWIETLGVIYTTYATSVLNKNTLQQQNERGIDVMGNQIDFKNILPWPLTQM